MKYHIDIKGLGIRITPATPQEEIDRLCATYPEVKKLIDHLSLNHGKESTTKTK